MILLTGGTGIIGQKLIADLSAKGFDICFTSRDSEKVEEIEKQHSAGHKSKGTVKGIVIDLESSDFLDVLDQYMKEHELTPSVLINNARNTKYLEVDDEGISSPENWIGEFTLGVIVPYQLAQHFANRVDSKLESIINVASIYGVVAPTKALYNNLSSQSAVQYGTVKAALIHLTRELAVRLSDRAIRVNSISYGGVEGRESKEFNDLYSKFTPQGRMLNGEDLAGPVEFLISSGSSAMNGHNLVCDGGWTIW